MAATAKASQMPIICPAIPVDDLLRGVDEAPLAACEGGEEGRPLCGGAEAGGTEGDEAFVWGS